MTALEEALAGEYEDDFSGPWTGCVLAAGAIGRHLENATRVPARLRRKFLCDARDAARVVREYAPFGLELPCRDLWVAPHEEPLHRAVLAYGDVHDSDAPPLEALRAAVRGLYAAADHLWRHRPPEPAVPIDGGEGDDFE